MTQNDKVLRHLREVGPITPMAAMSQYGIMRLGARIYDLKRMWYNITASIVTGKNRYGERTMWASYRLEDTNV